MSKKKNKKYFTSLNDKKDKKGKKGKKIKGYEAPKLKTVKPNLDKSEAKKNTKILLAPVEIPKEFIKNRNKCNHAGKTITVAEFKAMTPTYAAYTPQLDSIVDLFGEDNVRVCKSCYDVLVTKNLVSVDDVLDSVAKLYAAANIVVANKRMKDDEVKDIAKVKTDLADWMKIAELLGEIDTTVDTTYESGNSEISADQVSKLNQATNYVL